MKKLLTLILAVAVCAGALAKPKFVGHRGSRLGVENTVEAFENGAKRGYEYLETDIKVTKDLQFVCTHDDNTSRLGSVNLDIASSTLAELQAVTLTQTRNSVKYTGRLASLQEYLAVCEKYDVRPVIELKWATGVNSNDQSNMPLLVKAIEDCGFRNKCIILTSMKPCLEYLRKNYPDIELQFLTGQYWANHFDWCVEYGIDVDIETGYFDKATIDKFHDAGLDVNVYTINSPSLYEKYGNWGVDFFTTDDLIPADMPELDPLSAIRVNKIDYPESSASPRGWFLPQNEFTYEWPAEIAAADVRRMVYSAGKWFVLSTTSSASVINVLDPTTGKVVVTASAPESLSDLACGSDGYVYGVSMSGCKVYQWSSALDASKLIYTHEGDSGFDGCHRLAVSGPVTDAYIYITTAASSTATTQLIAIDLTRAGAVHYGTATFGTGVTPLQLGAYKLVITPTARENLIVESPLVGTVEYRFEREGSARFNVHATAGECATALGGRSYARRGIKAYSLVPGAANTFTLADIDGGIASPVTVCDPIAAFSNESPVAIASAIDVVSNRLFILGAGVSSSTYVLDTFAKPTEVEDVTIKIERLWLNSISTENAPENIDGTNAQQGTAVNGLFYINDCEQKLIYVFDKTGCIGSMPGGSGWGCCRDDAGNIIVRDDKLTDKSHTFLVYKAGSTPDNYETPLSFTAEVQLSGQTNFINASGNVLGELGYIYLYPKSQTAINILRLSEGKVKASTASGEISMTGSAAGYVIPVDNNSENWWYNVRAYGIYEYAAGENIAVSTSRGNTTVPNRNTTGGCARMLIRGNILLAHNSGTNYVGGFTLRNLSKDEEVIKSFDPIGTKGYTTGGNYSTFNWLIAEPIDDNSYYLYQYCPANGMGLYLVSVDDQGVDNITADSSVESPYSLSNDGITLSINGADADANVCVYSLSGALVATGQGSKLDISTLASGTYAVSVNGEGLKFTK